MAHFVLVSWLDTFDLTASLRTRAGLFKIEEMGLRTLPIRGFRKDTSEEDENFVAYKAGANWAELTAIRGRLKRIGDLMLGEIEFGRIFLEMLDPGAATPWRRETGPYFHRYQRAHLALRTNPGAALLAAGADGVESIAAAPGQMFAIPTRLLCSAVNLGEMPRVSLVVDFRRKEPKP